MVSIGNKMSFGSGFSTKLCEKSPVIRPGRKKANFIMRPQLFQKFERLHEIEECGRRGQINTRLQTVSTKGLKAKSRSPFGLRFFPKAN